MDTLQYAATQLAAGGERSIACWEENGRRKKGNEKKHVPTFEVRVTTPIVGVDFSWGLTPVVIKKEYQERGLVEKGKTIG